MLQQVLQGGDYSLFTQAALVLFFLSFIVLLALTFARPKILNDRYARMPLSDDIETAPGSSAPGNPEIDHPTARAHDAGQGAE